METETNERSSRQAEIEANCQASEDAFRHECTYIQLGWCSVCAPKEGETMSNVNTETRDEKIARLEAAGQLDPNCAGCKEFYEHPNVDPFAPRHKASDRCESGKRPHCTCDTCF